MKAPIKLKIGPFIYEIRWFDRAEEDCRKIYGQISFDDQIIFIAREKKRQRVATTFLHEVIHACHYIYGTKAEEAVDQIMEEDATNASANGLCACWRDNPDIWRWWQDLLLNEPDAQFKMK